MGLVLNAGSYIAATYYMAGRRAKVSMRPEDSSSHKCAEVCSTASCSVIRIAHCY